MTIPKGLTKYVLYRLCGLVPLLLIVSILVFLLLNLAPGDPAVMVLGADATPESVAVMRSEMGLDQPLVKQYLSFIKNVLHGNFGLSYQSGRPVTYELKRALPITITLSTIAIFFATLVGVLIGVISAVKQYSLTDFILRIVILAGVSVPTFWLGLMLMVIFTGYLGWLPSSGWGTWQEAILPCSTLSLFPLAVITRMTRSSMLEVIRQDYIRTAYSKGLSKLEVIVKHAMPNAMIPVINIIGLQFGGLLAGAVLVETVFAIPGLGQLTITAVFARDYPTIRATVILAATMFTVINLLVDVFCAFLNPRIKM